MSFIPGLNKNTGINISSIYSTPTIYIGDEYNQSVVSFKAFLETLSYDMKKETESDSSPGSGATVFKSKSGVLSIKLGFNVVASSLSEAKNNLAKVSHLQRSIRMQSTAGDFDNHKNRHIVYFSNLINNGYANNWLFVDQDSSYKQLRAAGFPCAIDEVSYEPDIQAGFLEGGDGLFPKSLAINLTLNPDMVSGYVSNSLRLFMQPFNSNGHYSDQDFASFPFLLKVGNPEREATSLTLLFNSQYDYSLEQINESAMNYDASKSKLFFAMPISSSEIKESNSLEGPSSTDNSHKILRYVVFKPFLEKFSRKFSTKTVMTSDPNGLLSQYIDGVATNNPVKYDISFSVPASSLTEAKHNAAKIQILMRMFFKKDSNLAETNQELESKTDETDTKADKDIKKDVTADSKKKPNVNDTTLNSFRVYIGGILQRGGTTYSHTTSYDDFYERSMYLQVSDLTVDIDVKAGFFNSDNKMYPKAYKVTMSLVDTHKENYLKQDRGGNYEYDFPDDGSRYDNRTGNDENRQSMLSRVTYWKIGGNPG